MNIIYRKLNFCAGHRLFNHEGKCKNLHGHEYVVTVGIKSDNGSLDNVGRIIDFSVIKEKLGTWIDFNFDHGMILSSEDGDAISAVSSLRGSKLHLLPYNPTAENIANYLLKDICPNLLMGSGVTVVSVLVQETTNCSAEATL